jgi:hypothetical protein
LKIKNKHFKYCRRFRNSFRQFKPVLYRNQTQAEFTEENPKHTAYVCPICFNNIIVFNNTEVIYSSEFNFDHYPPKSVGGRKEGLSCKSCNSRSGSEFEGELKDQLQHKSYTKQLPNSIISVRATIRDVPGGPYSGSMIMQHDGEAMFDLGTLARTPFVAKWNEKVISDPTNFEISIQGNFPDLAKVKKAIIKSAYWYCFARWGYQFSKSIGGGVMRKYISGECDYPIEQPFLYWMEDDIKKIPEGIAFINSPRDMLTLIVNIPMSLKETGYKCVVGVPIPNPTKDCWDDIKKLFIDDKEKQIEFTQIDHKFVKGIRDYESDWNSIITGQVEIYPPDSLEIK